DADASHYACAQFLLTHCQTACVARQLLMEREMTRRSTVVLHTPESLHSESLKDSEALRNAIENELKPRGPIEDMYVADLFNISWEILRWRRFKSNAINIRLRPALKHVIEQLLGESNDSFNELADNAEDLSILYYCNVTVKSEVA